MTKICSLLEATLQRHIRVYIHGRGSIQHYYLWLNNYWYRLSPAIHISTHKISHTLIKKSSMNRCFIESPD